MSKYDQASLDREIGIEKHSPLEHSAQTNLEFQREHSKAIEEATSMLKTSGYDVVPGITMDGKKTIINATKGGVAIEIIITKKTEDLEA